MAIRPDEPILVTGAAGFIGFHVSQRLLALGHSVIGVDNLNDYYDPALKAARLAQLESAIGFNYQRLDLSDRTETETLFSKLEPTFVIHLAAQAGVRHSISHPHSYVDANLIGFLNVLEGCRQTSVKHLTYASSSSVYGSNGKLPFSVRDNVDHPLSLYAATKKANELMAHSYSHLYALPTTGLRFFTVYGPWGRPDMAIYRFTKAIFENLPVELFNYGNMRRDFTYIDDIVEAIVRVSRRVPTTDPDWTNMLDDPGSSSAPYRVYNIGNSQPVDLLHVIAILEREIGCTAQKRLLPMQAGDVIETYADVSDLMRDVDFQPTTTIETGLRNFVDWYRTYHS